MADHSSFMDWSPAKPEPTFNPYQGNYMPGGWPAEPPTPTTGVFARPRPEGFLPKAKRICFGLATGSKIIASFVAVPLYCIVRQVRQQQKRPAKPQRSKNPIQGRALLTDSPWNRANAHVGTPRVQAITDSNPLPVQPTTTFPAPSASRFSNHILYTIPDLMPKGTISTKRKRESNPTSAPSEQERDLGSKTHAATSRVTTSSNPPASKRRQVNHSTHSGIMQPTMGKRHGPSSRPKSPTTIARASTPTRTASADSNTQSQEKCENSYHTNEPNGGFNLITSTWKSPQQLVDTTKTLLQFSSLDVAVKAVVSEKHSPTFDGLLTPPPIRLRRIATPTSSPTVQKDSSQPQIQTLTPESDISSTCPYSPGDPHLIDLNPMEESTLYAESQTSRLPSYQPDLAAPLPSTNVTGGGSPLPRSKPPTDLEHHSTLSCTADDHPLSSDSPKRTIVNDDGPQEASPDTGEGVSQGNSISAHASPSKTVGEQSGPETPLKNITLDELDLVTAVKSSESSTAITESDSSNTPSTPSPRTPGTEHLEKETSPSDRSKGQTQVVETPEKKLAQLTLSDHFNPDTPTPKASPHSAEKGHRVTRAETKRLQLLEEVHHYGIIPLEEKWEHQIRTALKNGHGNYKATDLTRVVPLSAGRGTDNWLNDEVINGYLNMVVTHGKKNNRPTQIPTHHAFVSFFYNNLEGKGYEGVKRWASRAKIGGKNLLETEQVFIPINSGMHWTLCVVSGQDKTITHYNSLGGNGQRYVNTVKAWVKEELGSSFKESEWTLVPNGESPQQANMDDCGVFTITSARQLMLGMTPMSYNAGQIPLQRKRIVAELINGGLIKSNE